MIDLLESVRNRCSDLDPAVVERHFHSLPVTYFERYAPTEIVRHVRLIAGLAEGRPVVLELRPVAAQTLEAVVAGYDHPGALSCIAAALAAQGFTLEDVQVSTYVHPADDATTGRAVSWSSYASGGRPAAPPWRKPPAGSRSD